VYLPPPSSEGGTVDTNNAYWTHTYYPPAIHVAPFDGGGGRVLVDIVAQDGGLSPQSLTHDNGYLYFVSPLRNDVERVQVDGGGLEVLAAGMHGPYWLVLDATDVYVGDDYSPNTIWRVPKGGGAAVAVAAPALQLNGLGVDATSVFWAGNDRSVWRVPK
jgi:hypothetical protein